VSIVFNHEDRNKINIGDPVFFYSEVKKSRGRYLSSGLDNKSGILVLTMLMKELLEARSLYHNVFCVLPSLEEVGGSHGAFTAAEKIKPFFAINVDVLNTTCKSEVGKGVHICVGPLINRVLSDTAIDVATKLNIPYRIKIEPGYLSSDTEEIVKANGGTPTLEINISCHNIHSPLEMVSKKDIQGAVKLLKGICDISNDIITLIPGGITWDVMDVRKEAV
jgi:putative aminopeptidase FrvX